MCYWAVKQLVTSSQAAMQNSLCGDNVPKLFHTNTTVTASQTIIYRSGAELVSGEVEQEAAREAGDPRLKGPKPLGRP